MIVDGYCTDCMNSGIVYGNACMIDGMIDRIEDEVGYKCKLVATGGLSSSIVKHCKKDIIIDEAFDVLEAFVVGVRPSTTISDITITSHMKED